jgi:hypothetical protein
VFATREVLKLTLVKINVFHGGGQGYLVEES